MSGDLERLLAAAGEELRCYLAECGPSHDCRATNREKRAKSVLSRIDLFFQKKRSKSRQIPSAASGKIIELEAHRTGWETWWSVCLGCGWNGVSVRLPKTAKFVECPDCGKMKVVRTAPTED